MAHILSILVALAWLPIIFRFYRDYMRRPEDERHPVSLAIISSLSIMVFHAVSIFVVQRHGWSGWEFTRNIILASELYVIVQFQIAFKIGQKKPLVRGRGN
jgi:hypothetical protein